MRMALDMSLARAFGPGGGNVYSGYALALRFKAPEYWASGTQYTPLSTFPGYTVTRSGIQGAVDASGAVQFFAVNVPAINSAGYHAYGALTNEALQSQTFDDANWIKDNATVTANSIAAPDGTTTADTLTASATTTEHRVYSYTISAAFDTSIFAKAGTASFISLNHGASSICAVFNLATGVVSSATGCTATITPCANGWYRCNAYETVASAVVVINMGTTAANAVAAQTWLGAGETVYVWQAQALANVNFPDGGPLITTTTAAASIGASDLRVTDSLASADMLIWATAKISGYSGAGVVQQVAKFSDGTAANKIDLLFTADVPSVIVTTASAAQLNQAGAAAATGVITLVAQRVGGNWRGGKVVGGTLTWFGAATAGSFPTGIVRAEPGTSLGTVQADDRVEGVYRKVGTFSTDAQVLAAIAETA